MNEFSESIREDKRKSEPPVEDPGLTALLEQLDTIRFSSIEEVAARNEVAIQELLSSRKKEG